MTPADALTLVLLGGPAGLLLGLVLGYAVGRNEGYVEGVESGIARGLRAARLGRRRPRAGGGRHWPWAAQWALPARWARLSGPEELTR